MIKLFIGKSAAGKDTLAKQEVKKGFLPIVSYTTRPIREGETDGEDYIFVSHDEFQYLIESGTLLEYRYYDTLVGGRRATWFYGTPLLNPTSPMVGVVTPEGVIPYIEKYGADLIEVVYVVASNKIRKERAKKRGSFDESEWERREKTDERDFSEEVIAELEKKLGKPVVRIINEGEK